MAGSELAPKPRGGVAGWHLNLHARGAPVPAILSALEAPAGLAGTRPIVARHLRGAARPRHTRPRSERRREPRGRCRLARPLDGRRARRRLATVPVAGGVGGVGGVAQLTFLS